MWSAPRSLSTCTMYSFSRRPDTKVLDEPLYAYRLYKNPSVSRPYRDELIKIQGVDPTVILNDMINYKGKSIVFAKHMSQQYPIQNGTESGDERFKSLLLNGTKSKHIILIRDPVDVIASYREKTSVHGGDSSLALGYSQLTQVWSDVERTTGQPPIVLDSDLLKINPKIILQKLCKTLRIDFYEEQLSWPSGPKPGVDGCWAKYWYDTVHNSTGFSTWATSETKQTATLTLPTKASLADFTPSQIELYYNALPFYERFKKHAIKL